MHNYIFGFCAVFTPRGQSKLTWVVRLVFVCEWVCLPTYAEDVRWLVCSWIWPTTRLPTHSHKNLAICGPDRLQMWSKSSDISASWVHSYLHFGSPHVIRSPKSIPGLNRAGVCYGKAVSNMAAKRVHVLPLESENFHLFCGLNSRQEVSVTWRGRGVRGCGAVWRDCQGSQCVTDRLIVEL